jgi:hypothetical protein|tara:strand:+ start:229 stop:519 length:291 start_codon:yes stop_codon:yes gene_type:complete
MERDDYKKMMGLIIALIPKTSDADTASKFLASIMANIILSQDKKQEWPSIMMHVSCIIADHILIEKEREGFLAVTAEAEGEALRAANDFMDNILGK